MKTRPSMNHEISKNVKLWYAVVPVCLVMLLSHMAPFASGAIIVDRERVTGANAIDPPGSRTVDTNATNVTPMSELTSIEGFGAVQNWSGISAGTNIFSFTDPLIPDLRLSFSGSPSGDSGGHITNSGFVTSGSSGMRFNGSNATATVTLTIDFGSWDGTTFDGTVNSVRAAGFTVSPVYEHNTITAVYYDASGTALMTQVVEAADSGGTRTSYFGYDAGDFVISYIQVSRSATANGSSSGSIDDLGFTIIPEPGTLALLGLAGLLLLKRRRV